jgi:chemotaxis protein histidine kinase CheA
MDTEQQVRLNFLEEVGDYFNQLESVILSLTQTEANGQHNGQDNSQYNSQQLDAAMRAAHSVKGGPP